MRHPPICTDGDSPAIEAEVHWRLVLSGTASTSLTGQLINSGFRFEVSNFASSLACTFRILGHLAMTFTVVLSADADLGVIGGIRLGRVHLAGTRWPTPPTAEVSPGLSIVIDGTFESDGTAFAMPRISVRSPGPADGTFGTTQRRCRRCGYFDQLNHLRSCWL
jgi:hypothetical protein